MWVSRKDKTQDCRQHVSNVRAEEVGHELKCLHAFSHINHDPISHINDSTLDLFSETQDIGFKKGHSQIYGQQVARQWFVGGNLKAAELGLVFKCTQAPFISPYLFPETVGQNVWNALLNVLLNGLAAHNNVMQTKCIECTAECAVQFGIVWHESWGGI